MQPTDGAQHVNYKYCLLLGGSKTDILLSGPTETSATEATITSLQEPQALKDRMAV